MGIEIRGEVEAALEIWPCGYRIKCNASGCTNLARIIVRRVRGTFEGQNEYCNKDARKVIEAANARGVAVHDMRR